MSVNTERNLDPDLVFDDPVITAAIYTAENVSTGVNKNYTPVPVERFVVTTNEIEEYLSKAELSDDSLRELGLKAGGPSRKLDKTVTVSEDILLPIAKSLNLSAYDRAVLEAIYSQILATPSESNCLFSIRSLYNIMRGVNKRSKNLTIEQKDALCSTIERLMSIVVKVELTGMNRSNKIVKKKATFNLISASINEFVIGGVETTSVRILSYPEFLAFARQKGGVTATPIDMLTVPINMTVRNTAVLNYLQHLVSGLTFSKQAEENRKRLPTSGRIVIDYNTIYRISDLQPLQNVGSGAAGQDTQYSRTYTNRVRMTVRKILDYWVELGYIRSWEEIKSVKNRYEGVSISLRDLDEKQIPLLEI